MPGPLPDKNARRRNAPTIPTTNLPISGRTDPAPDVPEWTTLGTAGVAWWKWAWSTPQACAWGVAAGMESWIARRASLEDDLDALAEVEGLDFGDLMSAESAREFRDVVSRVAALATGRLQILKEMREMDDRLGLTPKGLAALRWQIVAGRAEPAAPAKGDGTVTVMDDRRKRLSGAS